MGVTFLADLKPLLQCYYLQELFNHFQKEWTDSWLCKKNWAHFVDFVINNTVAILPTKKAMQRSWSSTVPYYRMN